MKRKNPRPEAPPAPQTNRDADAELLPTEDELDTAEDLHEAEAEIGINQWIDPDTGVPAEDSVPRLEDH
jgi:hypothetical protein